MIDFDWGGKERRPHSRKSDFIRFYKRTDGDTQITKEHDERFMEYTKQQEISKAMERGRIFMKFLWFTVGFEFQMLYTSSQCLSN